MISTAAGAQFVAYVTNAPTGLVGTMGVEVVVSGGASSIARTTAGITEVVTGSGVYRVTLTAPLAPGSYLVVWDTGGATPEYTTELLEVAVGLLPNPTSSSVAYPDIANIRLRARSLQRVVVGRPFVASVTYGDDDDTIPTGPVTLTLANAAGHVLADTVTATQDGDSGRFTYPVSAATPGRLDLLTALWTTDRDGEPETVVTAIDVCASRFFPLAALRKFEELADYTTEELEQARLEAECFLEAQCGCAFAARYGEHTITSVRRVGSFMLPHPAVHFLRSVLIDGEEVDDLSEYEVDEDGAVYTPYSLNAGRVAVAYEHGSSVPDAGRAALVLARHRIVNGPLDDRATGLSVEGGGVIHLLTPGVRGSVTGIPEVDVFIQRNAY